jgi:hypothetical protein
MAAMNKTYMAIDQYGNTYHNLTHPHKDLMERLGCKHANKMYVDRKGEAVHIGYVIGNLWLTVYEVRPFKG